MLILSLPAPFYANRPPDHATLEQTIRGGLERLASSGVAFVAMPCNSAHAYHARLAAAIDVPLLDMVAIAAQGLPTAPRRVALLAARPAVEAGLYQQALAQTPHHCLHDEQIQTLVDRLLMAIKTGQRSLARAGWAELLDTAGRKGADAALIACTDLNAVIEPSAVPLELLDATRMLATATVRQWLAIRD